MELLLLPHSCQLILLLSLFKQHLCLIIFLLNPISWALFHVLIFIRKEWIILPRELIYSFVLVLKLVRLVLLRFLLLGNMIWFLFLDLGGHFLGRFCRVMFLLLLHRLVMGLIVLCFGYRISILLFRRGTSFSFLVLVMRLFLYIGIFILDYIEISLIFKV